MPFDFAILDWIQGSLRGEFLDFLVPRITALGDHGTIWILLAAALLLFPKTRRMGAAVAAALLLEFVACDLFIKPLSPGPAPVTSTARWGCLFPGPMGTPFPRGTPGPPLPPLSPFGREGVL